MTTSRTVVPVSRRAALAGLGAGGLGLAFAARGGSASAQDATADALANHPIVGVWMVTTPTGLGLAAFAADGIHIGGVPTAQAGPQGVTFTGAQAGTWEPTGPRGIHFTGVQLHSDADGTFTGTVTIDGYPEVSEDGQTLFDDETRSVITTRDAAGAVLQVTPALGAPPVTGVRMGVGIPGFPAATPTAGTPTT